MCRRWDEQHVQCRAWRAAAGRSSLPSPAGWSPSGRGTVASHTAPATGLVLTTEALEGCSESSERREGQLWRLLL